jgi:putative tryptophan/tyrosine transport system substrate-binding protein
VFGPIENDAADIERSIESFASVPNSGLILLPDSTLIVHRDRIVALAARHRLPAVYPDRQFVAAGGLICYSTDRVEQIRRARPMSTASYAARSPADLPVEAPTKYETIVNLKTAKALGLAVPNKLLVAADGVIE